MVDEQSLKRVRGVFCATGYPTKGGVSSVMEEMIRLLAEDAAIHVVAWVGDDERPDVDHFKQSWASPFRLLTLPFYLLLGAYHLNRVLSDKKYAFVLAQDGTFTAAYCCFVGWLRKCPVYVMDHGSVWILSSDYYWNVRRGGARLSRLYRYREAIYRAILNRLAHYAVRRATKLLVAGEESYECYVERFKADKNRIFRYAYPVTVPPRGSGNEDSAPNGSKQADSVVISSISRIAPEKGLEDLLTASLGAVASYGRAEIIVAGDGPLLLELKEQFRYTPVTITWTGALGRAEVIRLLHRTDIFVYAGVEGTNFSMAVLEAMAAGCAVIASDAPRSNAALLANGRGLCISRGDPASFTARLQEAITRLVQSPHERREMGQRAYEFIDREFRPRKIRPQLLRALDLAA